MGSNSEDENSMGEGTESCETTIEIKVKRLGSQIFTLRVNKQMSVPDLKEQIASVTGILPDQQRLICRGRVLKDNQLLSAYAVEDGHTLHLVARQPVPPPSESFPVHPDQADGTLPDISQIVSAILGSFGVPSISSGSEGVDAGARGPERLEITKGSRKATDPTQVQQELSSIRNQNDRQPSGFSFPILDSMDSQQLSVIPDSVTILSQYVNFLRHEFGISEELIRRNNVQDATILGNEEREPRYESLLGFVHVGPATPRSLSEVLLSTGQNLLTQATVCLRELARNLQSEASMTDPIERSNADHSAERTGTLIYNLGVFLLELGRTIRTVQFGRSPSGAFVNAGPAVFIPTSGLNPLMVQPTFQPGTSFSSAPSGTVQSGSHLASGFGTEISQRHIDIPVQRGSSPTSNSRQQEPSRPRLFGIDIWRMATQNNQDSQGSDVQTPGGVNQLQRTPPNGEISVANSGSLEMTSELASATSSAGFLQKADTRVTDEGNYLSNSPQQHMPFIHQIAGSGTNVPQEETAASEHGNAQASSSQAESSDVGPSCQQSDLQLSPTNSKRQKKE